MPVIAIVGRPNVGKSSLLNALVGKRISIVQDMPGVTRDRISIPLKVGDRYVEIVDTGGYGFDDPDKLTDHIRHQIELAMARADLVLFLVDAEAGLTGGDQQIAELLRRQSIKTALLANKADGPKADVALGDFARLGLGTPVGISALNARNLDQVTAAIRDNLDLSEAPTEVPEPQLLVAIVGKRNAGKSTFVNAVSQVFEGAGPGAGSADRVIVSEVPGTTRDSVDVRFEKDGKALVVIDTAGVRKKRHMVTNDVEFYSFHRAQRSIRRSDVVLMLVDSTESVSEPDKQLARYIAEQYKPVIIVINKWDLARVKLQEEREGRDREHLVEPKPAKKVKVRDEDLMERFGEYVGQELPHLDFAPLAFVTAKDGKNVQVVLDLAQKLHKQTNERVGTGALNRAVKQIFEERTPSTPRGERVRVYYATQAGVAPPEIVLFVNKPDFVTDSYQRFIVNRFRELLPYPEVPIKLVLRGKSPKGAGPSLDEVEIEDVPEELPRERKRKPAGTMHSPKAAPRARTGSKPAPKKQRGAGRGTR